MSMPEGWPTSGMGQEAFVEAIKRRMIVDIEDIAAICKAALAAASTPTAQEPVGKIYQYYEWDRWNDCSETAFRNYKADGMKARVLHIYSDVPPAQEAKPVGEVCESREIGYAELNGAGVRLRVGTKLYAHPANDELRKAAEEILAELKSRSPETYNGHAMVGGIERKLRAALEGK